MVPTEKQMPFYEHIYDWDNLMLAYQNASRCFIELGAVLLGRSIAQRTSAYPLLPGNGARRPRRRRQQYDDMGKPVAQHASAST